MQPPVPRRSNLKTVVWIKSKGGNVFGVEEKVAWMFTKIRKAWLDQQPLEKPENRDQHLKVLPAPFDCHTKSICACQEVISSSPSKSSSSAPLGSEENPIFLEIVRGGIFALMLRWARHHSRGYSNNLTILNQQLIHDRLLTIDSNYLSTLEPCCHSSSSSQPNNSSASSLSLTSHSLLKLTEVSPWDQKFFSKLTKSQVFEMLQASSILGLTLLTEMLAKTVADQIRGKSPGELRKEFNIENDFTAEEEEEIKADTERMLERLHFTCDQPSAHHCAFLTALGSQAQMRALAEFMTPQKFPFISSAYTA